MTKSFSKVFSVLTILALMLMAVPMQNALATGSGSISLTTLGSASTQDFNTLAITGTTNTSLPLGWYLTESGGGARDNEAYAADNGGSGTGDTYSYGATGITERAFGGLLSGTLVPILGASFTNNTGSTISQLNISYMGEQWRIGTLSRVEQIDFQISNDATSLDSGNWADVNTLDFVSPVQSGTTGALNGNVAPNRTTVSSSITGLSIPNGATFWIRWMDFNASGADDGLSVDDFFLTPIFVPTPTNPTGVGLANPSTVIAGASTLLTVTVTSGANPTSAGLAVTCNLVTIGGSASQAFFDNNTNGDVTSGDNIFSFQVTVDSGTSAGAKNLPCVITDNYPRSGNASIALTVQAAPPPPGSVVVSQVYGGGGNAGAIYKNDFIELYNRTANTISLAGWSVQYASATGSTWAVTTLSGSIAPGKYYLVQEGAGAGGTLNLPAPDATGSIAMSATAGKVALVNNSTALTGICPTGSNISDFVGYGTTANCYEGSGPTPAPSNTTAAIRLGNGAQDTNDNSVDFAVGAPNPRNSIDPAPAVSSTTPSGGAAGVALNANITINFSEPVNVTDPWFTISCANSGSHMAAVSGGPSSFVLDPNADFTSNELCTVTVLASQITDQDSDDPPDAMLGNFVFSFTTIEILICGDPSTPIHAIQGSGPQSPIVGATNVVIEGIVIGDYQNTTTQFSGFYVQEEDAEVDADPATSEGIFIFDNGFGVDVQPGNKVRVRGNVFELISSGQPLTELTSVNYVGVCSTGNSLPAPTNVNLPVTTLADWEAYEGMLVNIPQTLTVTETFTLARFGEVSLSVDGRLFNPTNIVAPGAPATAQQNLNDRRRIVLDDGNNQQNIDPTNYPAGGLSASNTLRSGYTVNGLTGVLEQRFGVYRVQPVGAINFSATNPRSALPDAVGGTMKVASFNVLNYFNGNGLGGGFPTSRGANTLVEFDRQRAKTVSAIVTMDADVIGLMEMENDALGNSAIEDLVAGLNSATAPGTYGFIDTGVVGTDVIRVALIYRTATVTPYAYGAFAILDSTIDPNFIDTKNRPTLAQTFQQNSNGALLTVVVNHLKSKGSDCNDVGDPDIGDGQGNCNITRTAAANAIVDWLATDPTGAGDPDYLIIGDLNSYAMEDPITAIKNAGYTNLLNSISSAYSYVFNGQSGYLDHALASSALTPQVSGVTEWHINADESIGLDYNVEFKSPNQINTFYAADPFRSSDHDPVIVGLNLNDPPTVSAGGPYSVAEGGSVVVSATGSDPNPYDTLTYAWDLDNNGSFETSGQSPTFNVGALDGPNSYIIKVRATDTGGLFAINTATVDVANVTPTATFGTPGSVNEGSSFGISLTDAFDPSAADTTAGFTYAFDCGTGYGAFGSSSGATCSAVDNPGVTVKGKIQDKDGGVTEYTAAVVINNVAPSVTAAFASASLSCGTNNATLNVSFTDPGTADTHTAVIDWGDGNTQTVSSATSPFSLTHTYAVVGIYNATVTVTDDDGGVGTASASATVGYNTSGFLQPINTDGTSVFKYNSTIPVKISFTNCDGSIPANLAPAISLTMLSGATPGLQINEPISTSAADTTGVMRFSTNQYIYNLATKPLPDSSATYLITVTIPSTGQTVTVQFGLKP